MMQDLTESSFDSQSGGTGAASREKSFECTYRDCRKRFTRAEHLQRHALNHDPGPGHACPLCRAHFKRPDLLNRHMDRHRQKDLEAGGPGRGVLDTRKRAWIGQDGTVMEERPFNKSISRSRRITRRAKAVAQRQLTPDDDQGYPDAGISTHLNNNLQSSTALNIEPARNNQTHPQGPTRTNSQVSGVVPDLEVFDLPDYNYQPDDITAFDAFKPQGWKDQFSLHNPLQGYNELDYEQLFQPDTASSFNMPYTTALDYSWLFKSNPTLHSTQTQKETDDNFAQQTHFTLSPVSTNSSQLWTLPSDATSSEAAVAPNDRDACFSPQMASRNERAIAIPATTGSLPNRTSNSSSCASSQRQSVYPQAIPSPERPFSTLDGTMRVPRLDDTMWRRVLETIEAANPCLPDSTGPIWDHSLLSIESLQNYLYLFFSRFNTAYSLIHLPTFDPGDVEPLLLLAILLLGATYSDKDAHQLAVCIHDVIRPSIFAHAGFSAQPKLWNLQTILLVECFGKSRAGLKQHEMSHLFHGLLINLIRRSNCQSVKPTGPVNGLPHESNHEKAWRQWAIAEQKKRLALFCFMWDTQHAVLFCQSLCMSSFELRVDLPCPQDIWEAKDSASWASAWRCTPTALLGIPYLVALKSYLSPSTPRPAVMDSISRILLLHGLMSVAWDMQRRDQTALGLESATNGAYQGWKIMIKVAYDAWQSDFETHCAAVIGRLQEKTSHEPNSQLQADRETCQQMSTFASCYTALARCAQVLLHMDFLDVQIYAGARHILGRPVQQKDYVRSADVVKKWAATANTPSATQADPRVSRPNGASQATQAQTRYATVAATHAAHVLHEHVDHLTGQDAMSLFHVPWCLYLLTLTLWAYHHARPVERRDVLGGDFSSSGWDDEIVWDPHGEMRTLMSEMINREDNTDSRVSRRRTNGLVWVMAETLTKVRWGIVHAGVSVLKGLVPQRLINRYDDPMD